MAYIYKITNDINNKIYIGRTNFDIEKRFREHINDSRKEYNSKNRPLYNAIKKYGKEHFHIEIIEETDFPEEREKYWIRKLDSIKNGYNFSIGGKGNPKYIDYEFIYKTYFSTKKIKTTAELCKCDIATVRKALKKYGVSKRVVKRNGITAIKKPVAKIDINTGEILEVFESISEAEKKYPKHITCVCSGKRKTCGGFKWKYL